MQLDVLDPHRPGRHRRPNLQKFCLRRSLDLGLSCPPLLDFASQLFLTGVGIWAREYSGVDRHSNSNYRLLAANVLHWSGLPLSTPRRNHSTRWAELPWVNDSGTT